MFECIFGKWSLKGDKEIIKIFFFNRKVMNIQNSKDEGIKFSHKSITNKNANFP